MNYIILILLNFMLSSYGFADDVVIHGQAIDLTKQKILSEFTAQPQNVQEVLKRNEVELKKFIDALYNELAYESEINKTELKADPIVAKKIEIAVRKVLIDEFVTKKKQSIVLPDMEPLAQAEYDAHPEKYMEPEMVKARHILLAFDDKNKAEQLKLLRSLKERIEKGEDFAELAKKFSTDKGSAQKGGELGVFPRNQMVKPFEEAAFALTKPGQLSDLIESPFGFHLIQLEEHLPPKQRDFNAVKKELIASMQDEYVKNEMKAWREAMIDPKKATLNQAELEKVVADIKAIK